MEVHTDLNIESKPVLLPEVNRWILILIFPLGGSNMPISMKVTTGDIDRFDRLLPYGFNLSCRGMGYNIL